MEKIKTSEEVLENRLADMEKRISELENKLIIDYSALKIHLPRDSKPHLEH